MAQNLEIKIAIDTIEQITELIKLLGATYTDLLIQKDTYYNYDKGLLKLRKVNGKFELIKYNRDEINRDRWSDYELLFLEGEDVEKYLASIFKIDAIVEKERILYMYNNTRIHIDKVKNLGNYLELETVVLNSQKEAKEEFDFVSKALKLDLNKQIKTSYRFLVEKS